MLNIDFMPLLFIHENEYYKFRREFRPGQIISVGEMYGDAVFSFMRSKIFIRIVSMTHPKAGFFKFQNQEGVTLGELPDGRQRTLFRANYYTDDRISVSIPFELFSVLSEPANQIGGANEQAEQRSMGYRVTVYDDNVELEEAMSNLQVQRHDYRESLRRLAEEEQRRAEEERRQEEQRALKNEAAGRRIMDKFRNL